MILDTQIPCLIWRFRRFPSFGGEIPQTLLHELCHAAAWVIDHQCKPPHGAHFWAWADRAKAIHPGVPVSTCHSYEINYKYRYVCVGGGKGIEDLGRGYMDEDGVNEETLRTRGCGAEIGRHSKSIDIAKMVSPQRDDPRCPAFCQGSCFRPVWTPSITGGRAREIRRQILSVNVARRLAVVRGTTR